MQQRGESKRLIPDLMFYNLSEKSAFRALRSKLFKFKTEALFELLGVIPRLSMTMLPPMGRFWSTDSPSSAQKVCLRRELIIFLHKK